MSFVSGICCLERYSKHWPLIISDTLIFNMQAVDIRILNFTKLTVPIIINQVIIAADNNDQIIFRSSLQLVRIYSYNQLMTWLFNLQ